MDIHTSFPDAGRRVVFYLLYDERGVVDDYVPYKLDKLRPFAQWIVVIVNGALTDEGLAVLESVADEVWQRENVGYDVGGYQMALERFGQARLAEFDELILMNYTWFGPVRPFADLFRRMDSEKVDFWGLTDHAQVTPNPVTLEGTMLSHIQSHWIAVRRSMFLSDEWTAYWRDMPVITSYAGSILNHEARFTDHFASSGRTYAVAFPHEDYPTTLHPAFENAQLLLDDGCPALKRRPFFHDPLYLDRHAIIGRWLAQSAASEGYPAELIWQSMARAAQPRVLYTNASMMEILPETADDAVVTGSMRVVAIVHAFYPEMVHELLDRLAYLPVSFDLVVTTASEENVGLIERTIASRADVPIRESEVRLVASNRGRDQAAFYVTCRDVVTSSRYDLVIKLHSKRSVQDGYSVGAMFKRQQLDNLLHSPGYAANVLALFEREKGLGLVFPPMVHIGYPTMGGAWFDNRDVAVTVAERAGIRVPLDESSPLAPYGGMFIARVSALAPLTKLPWTFEEYASEEDYGDGALSHVQERLVSYAAAEVGMHTRTVANAEYAAISHTLLEYKLDRISAPFGGYGIDAVRRANEQSAALGRRPKGEVEYLKDYIINYHPRSLRSLILLYRPLRALRRLFSRRTRAGRR